MAATVKDYKKYADKFIEDQGFIEPVRIVSGFKVKDGFVYQYNYVNPPKNPTHGLDDPFIKVLYNRKITTYSPYRNMDEFSKGMETAVRFT